MAETRVWDIFCQKRPGTRQKNVRQLPRNCTGSSVAPVVETRKKKKITNERLQQTNLRVVIISSATRTKRKQRVDNHERIRTRTCLKKKKKRKERSRLSIYKRVLGKPAALRRHRVSLAGRVQFLLRATSAKKKKKFEKSGEKKQTRTYRRVGLLHRHAQDEDEQRQGELALQGFIHLWDSESMIRLRSNSTLQRSTRMP